MSDQRGSLSGSVGSAAAASSSRSAASASRPAPADRSSRLAVRQSPRSACARDSTSIARRNRDRSVSACHLPARRRLASAASPSFQSRRRLLPLELRGERPDCGARPDDRNEQQPDRHLRPGWRLACRYSMSAGLLNSGVSAIAPWPFCGKFVAAGLMLSVFDAVSSGGNSTRLLRNASTRFLLCARLPVEAVARAPAPRRRGAGSPLPASGCGRRARKAPWSPTPHSGSVMNCAGTCRRSSAREVGAQIVALQIREEVVDDERLRAPAA